MVSLVSESAPPVPAARPPDRRTLLGVAVILLATFMDLLDATIIGVALPSIQRDLFTGNSALQWIVAGYVLAFAVLLVIGGRLGDMYGRKTMFLAGVAGFTLSSVACGLAISPAMLIGSRVVQGMAAAVMIPQVLTIMRVDLAPRQRTAAYMLYGAVTSLATVLGPVLGGLLVDADLLGQGWRMIFLINLPIGVLTLVAAALLLTESRDPKALRPDLGGVLLLTLALLLVLYPLVKGHETGWPLWGFVAMAASLPVLAAFGWYERRKRQRDDSPLVDLGLFRERSFNAGLLLAFLLFSQVSSFFFAFVIFLQTGLGYTPMRTGLTLLWWSLGVIVAGTFAVRLVATLGARLLAAGAALMAVGMAGMSLTLQLTGPQVSSWTVAPAMLLTALGVGAITPILIDTVIAGVPAHDAGAASGIVNTMMQVGAAVGIAIVGAVFFSVLTHQGQAGADTFTARLRTAVADSGLVAPQSQGRAVELLRACKAEQIDTRNSFLPPPACFEAMGEPDVIPPGTAVRLLDDLESETVAARENAFTTAMKTAVWYHVLVSVVSLLLVRLLPRRPVDAGRQPPAPA